VNLSAANWHRGWIREYTGLLATVEICTVKIGEPHPRGPSVYFPEKILIAISERITPFHELAKIALLHEVIHVKLYAENEDADEAHGKRFQAEMQRLIAAGAYNNLL
jgi:hypothetical protein